MHCSENIFEDAIQRLDRAVEHADIDPEAVLRLKFSKQVLEVSIPVRMDNGSLRVFTGYRVRHDDTRGPTKGGIRYHPECLSLGSQGVSVLDDLQMRRRGVALRRG